MYTHSFQVISNPAWIFKYPLNAQLGAQSFGCFCYEVAHSVFVGHTLILLVLSCRGSNYYLLFFFSFFFHSKGPGKFRLYCTLIKHIWPIQNIVMVVLSYSILFYLRICLPFYSMFGNSLLSFRNKIFRVDAKPSYGLVTWNTHILFLP